MQTATIGTAFLSHFVKLKDIRNHCEQMLVSRPEWIDEEGIKTLQLTIASITAGGKPIDFCNRRNRPNKSKKQSAK